MTCTDVEKRIYLYNELSEREREQTDHHLRICASCRHTMQQVIRMDTVVAANRSDIPTMRNEALMTRRVMDSIAEKQKIRSAGWDRLLSAFVLSRLRYGMAVLSIFLIALFIGESSSFSGSFEAQKPNQLVPGANAALDLASFHSALLERKRANERTSTLFGKCIAECLNKRVGDCEDCANNFVKP